MKKKQVILGVGAHPDDLEVLASGTFATFIKKGWEAYYVILTDGSRGSNDPHMTHAQLAQMRRDEQLKAKEVLGLQEVFFLDYQDTELIPTQQLKEQIVRVIRRLKPTIVISWDPQFWYTTQSSWSKTGYINHTDHRAAAVATVDAVFPLSRDRLTFLEHEKEGLSPHPVEELWLMGGETGNHIVDITQVIETKIETLLAHRSQFPNPKELRERVIRRAKEHAKGKKFLFGECFVRLVMP